MPPEEKATAMPWLRNMVTMLVVIGMLAGHSARAEETRRRALIIHSYHHGFTWTNQIDRGIRDEFAKRPYAEGAIDLMTEYMDYKRHPDAESLALLHDQLKHKYADMPIALLFVSDNGALDFVLRHRREIWPGVPLVFCGVNGYTESLRAGQKGITGVAEDVDIVGTLRQALKLHPRCNRATVILDDTLTSRQIRKGLEASRDQLPRAITLNWLQNKSVEEMHVEITDLDPARDILLIASYNRAPDGTIYSYEDISALIRDRCPVPIYGLWSFYIGHGVMGGRLLDGYQQGQEAAMLGIRILRGEDADGIPVARGKTMVAFDYNEIRRFGLSRADLPAGSVVINAPYSFYQTHKRMVHVIAVAFLILIGVIAMLLTNIGARRRAEKALRDNEERFRAIAHYTHDWESWNDPQGRLCWVNPAVERMTGYTVEECLAMPDFPLPLLHPKDRDRLAPVFSGDSTQASCGDEEFRYRRKDGAYAWGSLAWQPIFADTGRPAGVRYSVRDISTRKQHQQERERLNIELGKKNNELEGIIYTISHDLRSPLVNVHGFSRELQHMVEEAGDLARSSQRECPAHGRIREICVEDMPKALRFVIGGVEKMSALLEGLLRLSRLGRESLSIKAIDMNALLQEVAETSHYKLKQEGVDFHVGELPSCLGDPTLVGQVFTNLVDNGIKYRSPERPPRIDVTGVVENNEVVCTVADNGRGIPESMQQRVFGMFERGAAPPGSAGDGLGLTICVRILHRLRGRIWVESEEGRGSRFFVSLPLVPASDSVQTKAE